MVDKIKMVSLTAHKFGSKHLQKGDELEATPREAKLLRAIRRAEDAPAKAALQNTYATRVMTADTRAPAATAIAKPDTARGYRTRAVAPESAPAPAAALLTPPASSAPEAEPPVTAKDA